MLSDATVVSNLNQPPEPVPTRSFNKAIWGAAIGLLVLHVILAWLLRDQIGMGNDDAMYIQLSRSLRVFGYREEFLIGAPWHSQYPPLYAMLLAVISTLAGERVDVLIAASTLLSAGALLLIFDAVRRLWSPLLALMVLTVGAVNYFLLEAAGDIGTEAPYMALSALSFWFLSQRSDTKTSIVLAGAAAIAAALTRSVGVALVASLLLLWLIERRYHRVIMLGIMSALFVGSWLIWTVVSPVRESGRSYVGEASQLIRSSAKSSERTARPSFLPVRHLVRSTRVYLAGALPTRMHVPTISGTSVDNVVWLLLFAVCSVVGALTIWRTAWRSTVIYLLLYVGLLVVWIWPVARFLDPILPFLFLTLLAGAAALGKRMLPRAPLAPAVALTVVITASSLAYVIPEIVSAVSCDRSAPLQSTGCFTPHERAWLAAAVYAREQTPASTRFMASKEGAFSYLSDRKLVAFANVLQDGSEGVIQRMQDANVRYVVIGTGTGRERRLARVLMPVCERLAVAQMFPPHTAILEVLPGLQTDPVKSACPILVRAEKSLRLWSESAPTSGEEL